MCQAISIAFTTPELVSLQSDTGKRLTDEEPLAWYNVILAVIKRLSTLGKR